MVASVASALGRVMRAFDVGARASRRDFFS